MLTYSEKRGTYSLIPLENSSGNSSSIILDLWHCTDIASDWPQKKDMWPGLNIDKKKIINIEDIINGEFNFGQIENLSLSPNEKFYTRESYLFEEGILIKDRRREYLLERGNRNFISTNLPEFVIALVTRDENSMKKLCERFSLASY